MSRPKIFWADKSHINFYIFVVWIPSNPNSILLFAYFWPTLQELWYNTHMTFSLLGYRWICFLSFGIKQEDIWVVGSQQWGELLKECQGTWIWLDDWLPLSSMLCWSFCLGSFEEGIRPVSFIFFLKKLHSASTFSRTD